MMILVERETKNLILFAVIFFDIQSAYMPLAADSALISRVPSLYQPRLLL